MATCHHLRHTCTVRSLGGNPDTPAKITHRQPREFWPRLIPARRGRAPAVLHLSVTGAPRLRHPELGVSLRVPAENVGTMYSDASKPIPYRKGKRHDVLPGSAGRIIPAPAVEICGETVISIMNRRPAAPSAAA